MIFCARLLGLTIQNYSQLEYSNHMNTKHMNNRFIWLPDSMGVWYSNGKVKWLGRPFKSWTFWTIYRFFSVQLSGHHLKTWPFDNQTQIYYLETRLVRYSDGCCPGPCFKYCKFSNLAHFYHLNTFCVPKSKHSTFLTLFGPVFKLSDHLNTRLSWPVKLILRNFPTKMWTFERVQFSDTHCINTNYQDFVDQRLHFFSSRQSSPERQWLRCAQSRRIDWKKFWQKIGNSRKLSVPRWRNCGS